jgi:hypothetical protein
MEGFDLNNIHSIPQGFTILLIVMIAIAVALFYMFWKRQWIFIPGSMLHKNKDENENKNVNKSNNGSNQ